ncbi:hypothetical protein ACFS5M_07030 [Lacinutrix iliipiscaria]|uniref:Uncharacterized protein n=1 Tax=Lacinutrix iliipiscaria TaxID=1230532 RepID=A0ABW5WQ33_9FLAO
MAIYDDLHHLIDEQFNDFSGRGLSWNCCPFYCIFVIIDELRLTLSCASLSEFPNSFFILPLEKLTTNDKVL